MLITSIPPRYYQLALFNLALLIALYKELPALHLLFSLAFITVLVAPVALYFGFINRETICIVNEEIEGKLKQLYGSVLSCLGSLHDGDEAKRTKLIIYV